MCGIAGYIARGTQNLRNELIRMTDSLAHRGRDASGLYYNDGKTVGLGHRRLSILDLSKAANQPFYSACRRYVMVYNGEIYNYRDISKELNIKLKTTGDTEVVVEAFARWGPKCVHKFNGMFVIVVYDTQENCLHILRDRIGIKPLYVYQDNTVVYFSSEINAFKQVESLALEIDYSSIGTYLHLGYLPENKSIYKNVFKFPSGHTGSIGKELKLRLEPYWSLKDKLIKTKAYHDPVGELDALINKSVANRLISDVPFGTFLSGGIDSSLVSAIASRLYPGKLKTFSIGFSENSSDESRYARKVAEFLKSDHKEKILHSDDAISLIVKMLDIYGEPFADSSAIPTMLVSSLASDDVKMVLTGDGGDELFLGYGMYKWAHRLSKITATAKKALRFSLNFGSNRYQRASSLFEPQAPGYERSHIFSQEQYLFSVREVQRLIGEHQIAPYFDPVLSIKTDSREKQAYYDINHYLKDDLLVKVDRASMRYSLEARVPLLDHQIVEWAVKLDPKLKSSKGVNKRILKKVLYRYIPSTYFDRPKGGFSIPLAHWLRGDLSYLMETYLSQDLVDELEVFDYQIIEMLKSNFLGGKHYLYNRLWTLIVLVKFLKEHYKL
ncbi:MAG: asparagine synthase (glutamine-hydrolyzing) [Fulvivirga sp.]